ncbi:glycosyltransferase family 4 protein [Inmirania thermothiophila]|uniref:Glycosyltransferase involved in cell wall biosynthesis n=1 Tax=Inmirania thermothiophila TaxID=1750597 RepID=A0A3N1Y9I7_9GAMM|nr:glycosyltransferase family 4 protein [Inmirania thermothiophila]ROR35148.1 glycosyltransferase involved in cell wall biosynthesis [Inmirania thermothiophila]
MKVLISAYACEPGKGSEPGVGWNWVRQSARLAEEVWVITRANNREAIEKALAEEPLPNVRWVYFDLPRWARFWKKGQRGVHLYYYLWQIGNYFLARRLHRQVGFDLVHHVTFVNYWMPSFLALLPSPFIWGPVGGGESAPKAFYQTFSLRGKIYETLRDLARWLGEHDPFTRMTARKSALALATTEETAQRLAKLGARNVQVLSQVALASDEIARLGAIPPRQGNPFRLVSMGNLLHLKGFHLGMEAFARLVKEVPQSEYWLVGDGPERKNLERLARRLGVAEKVKFWGALRRHEALQKLAECDVLVHPSLHDSGGWVCVEAMAAGKPVICLDLGGPALQVTGETGFKIPARTPEQAVEEMAKAMRKLAEDPELRRRMGEAARKRVKEAFSWERRGEEIQKVYKWVLKNA